MSALVDAYLSHLAVERRLSPNTVESYGRDLSQLSAAAAALERPVEALDRRALEQVVRQMMGEGRSPRSVARAVACFRGFYRFLVVSGHRQDNPAVDVRGAARVEDAAEVPVGGGSRSAAGRAGHVAAARPARSRADRVVLRDRIARLGNGRACASRI